jgi:hypothetical protein
MGIWNHVRKLISKMHNLHRELKGKDHLEILGINERILKISVKGIEYEDMGWIQLAHDASNGGHL